jgi:DNA-binding NtrC family response regulator
LNRTILLVDDDQQVLTLLGRYFERLGWLVHCAVEADGAMDLYERERPDLVLLAIGLPGVSGLRLLEALRTRDADATVIMLTGAGEVATAVESMSLGAENFLTKPVALAHLQAAAERAWEKAELRRRLRNVLERVLLLSGEADEGLPAQLPAVIVGAHGAPTRCAEAELSLQDVERRHIARALAHHVGNRSRTARTLGISRATLYEKLARYGLDQVGRGQSAARAR